MQDRRLRLLGEVHPAETLGVEIGALHAPLVRRSEGRILYVDYADTDTLRALFRHPGVDAAEIVDVDIVWGRQSLRESVGAPADYVLASHVIEHVPDLIGWLEEVHGALRPGGVLGLAVPDRRHTFDLWRPTSTPGEMIEAYLCRTRRPSLRQVFDAAALSRDTDETWRPAAGLPDETLRRLRPAFDMVKELAGAPRYVDAHCWVFTPLSFLDTAQALSRMGCFPYRIEALFPTEPGEIEFQVRLRACERADDPAIDASIAAARAPLATPAAEAAEELRRCDAANRAMAAEIAGLQAGMDAIRRSTSWRVTAPLRWAGSRMRRGRG